MQLTATPWDEDSGVCDCCGNTSKTVWGDVSNPDQTLAVYYVQWTKGKPDHFPNIDLVMGPWGEGIEPEQRFLVSLLYDPGDEGGGFMVIDSDDRPANDGKICGRAMKRAEIVGTPLAKEVFQLVDTIWLQDPRIEEIRSFS